MTKKKTFLWKADTYGERSTAVKVFNRLYVGYGIIAGCNDIYCKNRISLPLFCKLSFALTVCRLLSSCSQYSFYIAHRWQLPQQNRSHTCRSKWWLGYDELSFAWTQIRFTLIVRDSRSITRHDYESAELTASKSHASDFWRYHSVLVRSKIPLFMLNACCTIWHSREISER